MIPRARAWLVLEDGTAYPGRAFGGAGEAAGEVVFHTGMTGYQEILTDPSYAGQIVVMTSPQIGNYGVNLADAESGRVHVEGLVIRELAPRPSNWRATAGLEEYLAEAGVPGIEGVDTRDLTRRLREKGTLRGVVVGGDCDPAGAVERAREVPSMDGRELVPGVTCQEPWEWHGTPGAADDDARWMESVGGPDADAPGPHVVVWDFGVKWNILRSLQARGCRVTVVPATTAAAAALERQPDGVVLSNGPGDPAVVACGIEAARGVLGELPVLGICLGHQLIGLAAGGSTFKLKFGHHGANHPVRLMDTGAVEITSQNHGFAVDPDSVAGGGFTPTRINLNDGTLEGMRHVEWPVLSVQYHPEAAPGPHDASPIFDGFLELLRGTPVDRLQTPA